MVWWFAIWVGGGLRLPASAGGSPLYSPSQREMGCSALRERGRQVTDLPLPVFSSTHVISAEAGMTDGVRMSRKRKVGVKR